MAIIAREKGTAIEPITEGVHTTVCIMVIDLGEQWAKLFKNKSQGHDHMGGYGRVHHDRRRGKAKSDQQGISLSLSQKGYLAETIWKLGGIRGLPTRN